MREIPYGTATAGESALVELQKVLQRFDCKAFGTMTDVERECTIVQFRWRDRSVSLQASWRGYAQAWLKCHPYSSRSRGTRQDYERRALEQGRVSVCSVLRDWVKGQVTAIECGVMSFEAAFMPHMLLASGERVIELIERDYHAALAASPATKALPAPSRAAS